MSPVNYRYTIHRRRFLKVSAIATAGLCIPLNVRSQANLQTVRFGLVTDSHYADRDPLGTRYYRESLTKMKEFIQVMENNNVDFIIHLGDFKDQDPQEQQSDTLRYLTSLENIYTQFQGPTYHCVGNHDVDSITKDQFLRNVTNTGIDQNRSYYSFDHHSYHFVVLDANYHPDGRDHYYKEGADWQKTHIPQEQLEWLRRDLQQTKRPTVIFCHHPLYPFPELQHTMQVGNYQVVQEILENSGNTLAVFQGHVHREHHHESQGIHYLTQLGMVDYSGLDNNSFSIVEIKDATSVVISGYKRVSDQQLSIGS
ncbi:MAG: alkaline phosphatase [Cyclobacteriaceae bacterium]|nr:MAG: alkaline phosphatase [Cyclobacteriaceae bacterium]